MVSHHESRCHYTCWVRSAAEPARGAQDSWVNYDDGVVGPPQPTLPPEVATDAYVVFYELVPRAEDIAPGPHGAPAERQASTGTSDNTSRGLPAADETVGSPPPEAASTAHRGRTPAQEAEDGNDVEIVDGMDSDDPMDTS